jgi:hypothetical protein
MFDLARRAFSPIHIFNIGVCEGLGEENGMVDSSWNRTLFCAKKALNVKL